jgi:hypothetical protein
MKKKLVPFTLGLLLSSVTLFSQSEEEKIKELLNAETEDFTKMAFAEVVKKHWILDDKAMVLVTMPDGNHVIEKKEELLADLAVPPAGHAQVQKSDYQFFINGNTALVTFTQVVTTEEGDKVNSHEIRYLEKLDGTWKIRVSSVHQFTPKG